MMKLLIKACLVFLLFGSLVKDVKIKGVEATLSPPPPHKAPPHKAPPPPHKAPPPPPHKTPPPPPPPSPPPPPPSPPPPPPPSTCPPPKVAEAARALNTSGCVRTSGGLLGDVAALIINPNCCHLLGEYFREAAQAEADGVSCACIAQPIAALHFRILGLRTAALLCGILDVSVIKILASLTTCLPLA